MNTMNANTVQQSPSADTVVIRLDAKWGRILRSPLYFVVSALQGVSCSFAPYFLYLSGQGRFFHGHERILVPVCFAVIFLVPLFYFRLASEIVRQLKQQSN
jgi:hypothetical protein